MKTINILSGPVQSGKTTRLLAWVKYHRQCTGLLSPVMNEVRYIYSILADNYRRLESIDDDTAAGKDVLKIGKYLFLKSTFQWAREELRKAMEIKPAYLVIDEIGPLELSGQGLEPMVSHILQNYQRSENHHIILVVRDSLLEDVISHYHLQGLYSVDHHFMNTP
jgi:nucleoside-triphosphatase THEP1